MQANQNSRLQNRPHILNHPGYHPSRKDHLLALTCNKHISGATACDNNRQLVIFLSYVFSKILNGTIHTTSDNERLVAWFLKSQEQEHCTISTSSESSLIHTGKSGN